MTEMELNMIRALAAIDDALGMPDDGCNSTENTITAINLLHSIIEDNEKTIVSLTSQLEAAKRQGEPVAWLLDNDMFCTYKETAIDAEAHGELVQPLYTTPPSTALSVELAIKECAKIAWNHEPDYNGPIETEILSLLQSPPSLEAHDRELAIRVAENVMEFVMRGNIEKVKGDMESLVDDVLKEMK